MKWFYLFLVFSILMQARDVCVPGSCHAKIDEKESTTCSKDMTEKKSCCQKNHAEPQNDSDEKSCGDESCHCLGCLKAFITSPSISFDNEEWVFQPVKKNTLRPVDFYVFDYTKDFYHPPQILSYT